jgi:hypothetical protein
MGLALPVGGVGRTAEGMVRLERDLPALLRGRLLVEGKTEG